MSIQENFCSILLKGRRGEKMAEQWQKALFAKNLRKYMEQSGKNQKELAEIAGVSAPTFNEWINEKKFPRIDKIQKLADYFGILKSDLIEEMKPVSQEEPATEDDGLTESQRKLIDFAKGLTEDQAGKVLQLMKSILAFDE
jgi:transcriptional regulator with XRE-family HTH domain